MNALDTKKCIRKTRGRERGAMVVTLIMLMLVLMLGLAAGQAALQSLKTAGFDRDREVAFQTAEAALRDAELDIEASPDVARSRSHIFSRYSAQGFPAAGDAACNSGAGNIHLGLCRHVPTAAAWQTAEFSDNPAATQSVAYGTFTGRRLQVAGGTLPTRLPRYTIELFSYTRPGESAERISYFYRITAVGFGMRPTTQVALQSFYRKEDE